MEQFFRYLKGYVKIKVWGYSPERFMNLCSNRGILLWDIRRREDYYVMFLSLSDFFAIKPIVKKTGTRAAVLERYGLPFFMRKIRARKVFVVGLPVCLIFLLVMSRFIWAMDFEGNVSLTDDVLKDFMIEQGVDYGTPRKDVDLEALETAIREHFDVVTWTSARIDGTKITVKVKENDLPEPEELAREWVGSDLVATKDGVVASILVRQGVPQVNVGSTVEKGQILVTGAIPVNQDDGTVKEYQYCYADADVEIIYDMDVSQKQPLYFSYKNYTGREKKDIFFALAGKRYVIPLGRCNYLKYDTVLEEHQVCLLDQIYLPIYYGYVVNREYLPVDAVYEEEQAREILEDRFAKNIASLEEKGVQIIRKDVRIETVGKTMVLKGTMQVQEKDGKAQPVEVTVPQETETQAPQDEQE